MKTTVRRILTEDPPPLGRAGAPPGLDRVLRRALAKDPAGRQESAVELAEMIREVQARAGFDRTPIPRLTGTADAAGPTELAGPEHEPGPAASGRAAIGAPPPLAARPVPPDSDELADGSDGSDSGVTIARARPVGTRPPVQDSTDANSGPGGARRWIAIGAMVTAVLAVTIGVFALGGGDDNDGNSPSSTIAGGTPTDPFFEILPAPSDVSIVALGGGSFEVHYVVPDGVASVEVVYANGDDARRIVTSDASPAVLDSEESTLCVLLRSIGSAGRVSADVGPVCSG